MARSALAVPVMFTIAAMALAACGDTPSPSGGTPEEDPADVSSPPLDEEDDDRGADAGEAGVPQEPWPEPGTAVQTAGPVDLLDDGAGTELCLGGMLESYPPQCGGIAVDGFEWDRHEGDYQNADGVRWGSFELTGTYDPGTQTLTVERSAPAGHGGTADPPLPQPERQVSAEELPTDWPGMVGSVGSGEHYPAFVEVIYDDGTLLDRLEEDFGAGNVQLHVLLTAVE